MWERTSREVNHSFMRLSNEVVLYSVVQCLFLLLSGDHPKQEVQSGVRRLYNISLETSCITNPTVAGKIKLKEPQLGRDRIGETFPEV